MQTLKNLTLLQWLGIIVLFNGVVLGGTTQLTTLFGAHITDMMVAVAGLGNLFFGGLITMFGGSSAMVKTVAAMPGVEAITVNANANQALAQIAVSNAPDSAKVEPIPTAVARVAATAKGN